MANIKLLKIHYNYLEFLPIGDKALDSIEVEFDYKNIKECKFRFKTNKELNIDEIKRKILFEITR
ncbi:hypothetical protein CF081_19610 [Clostridium botulinum]|uniref:hypothetical protein n=1 Tax=Clostridium botulinum TaxID=1491 RepID=UPI0007741C62|nr:hypothetical protein [Clostridium botulinum]AUN08977.1 hypothetical protein RSJ14_20150 [Clostridium botulinum]MBN3352625.1 hypothetical protein [Clostridium botulinum]MBN3368359.1 hypothetical protein [Clostridium botulinum]MBN3375885.1 hypothetical protein [Clostridium botulinum]